MKKQKFDLEKVLGSYRRAMSDDDFADEMYKRAFPAGVIKVFDRQKSKKNFRAFYIKIISSSAVCLILGLGLGWLLLAGSQREHGSGLKDGSFVALGSTGAEKYGYIRLDQATLNYLAESDAFGSHPGSASDSLLRWITALPRLQTLPAKATIRNLVFQNDTAFLVAAYEPVSLFQNTSPILPTAPLFKVTARRWADSVDPAYACRVEFGDDYRPVDFAKDLQPYDSKVFALLLSTLKWDTFKGKCDGTNLDFRDVFVDNAGEHWSSGYGPGRRYFLTMFNRPVDSSYQKHGLLPPGKLSRHQVRVALGSWWGDSWRILCVRRDWHLGFVPQAKPSHGYKGRGIKTSLPALKSPANCRNRNLITDATPQFRNNLISGRESENFP